MNLSQVKPRQHYRIKNIETLHADEAVCTRFRQLGFVEGMSFYYQLQAPIFKNPYLVEIRGMKIALSQNEANRLIVEEIS